METAPTDDPNIILAGRAWRIPRLTPRQNRVIVPILLELIPRIVKAREDGGGDLTRLARFMDTAIYDQLVTVAHLAVTRAQPAVTREEFEDLPIETLELVRAVATIAKQAGLVSPRSIGDGK